MTAEYFAQLYAFSDGIIRDDDRQVLDGIAPPPRGTAQKRFSIYTDGYRIRLQKAVEADYPCLRHYLGEKPLQTLVADFVEQTPSSYFNLDRYPLAFDSFVCANLDDPVACEIALLESTIASVFMQEESEPLAPSAFENLLPEQFGNMKLRARKASRLLLFSYLTHSYLTEFRAGETLVKPEPLPQYVYVYRHNNEVQRLELPQAAFLLLQCLFDGMTIGEALEHITKTDDSLTSTIAANLQGWFADWMARGVFTRD
ncbi:MAG: putative DNA-binding domain-containing protein [Alphaproteobacteria bacterium]